MLKLMFITPNPAVALAAMQEGVDRVFIDLETIGKAARQGGLDTVQSRHSAADVAAVKVVMLPGHELLVRSNPLHEGSPAELDAIVEAGADVVMLPYFQRAVQVREFVSLLGGRSKACLLIESKEAVENLDEILAVTGVDEYFVGLNDLHLDFGLNFMFEPLVNGLLDGIVQKLKATGKPYGFGGIARVGEGMVPGEKVMMEHYRLGSTCVIVSRTFCRIDDVPDIPKIKRVFKEEIAKLRNFEKSIAIESSDCDLFARNHAQVTEAVAQIVAIVKERKAKAVADTGEKGVQS